MAADSRSGDPGPERPWDEETSLADFLKARAAGSDFVSTAASFRDALEHFEGIGHNLYGRTLLGPTDARAEVASGHEASPRPMLVLASNNYLGLANHPRVVEAAREAAARYGVGAGSSPLLVGTFPVTGDLEARLAALEEVEAACVFPTGYAANLGVISAVVGRGDAVIVDRLAHASMVDGARLSGARLRVFRHNDPDHLDRVLARCAGARTRLVAVEGIYSMDGDLAPLDRILEVARRHAALLLVDEAHATGVVGPDGAGAAAHFGLAGQVDLSVGTLSKSLGACGGFVAGRSDLVGYLRYFARSHMFSTAPPPMVLAAASAALDVMRDEPERRLRLWENARRVHAGLGRAGFRIPAAASPILPVIVGSMDALRRMTLDLHRAGICVNSVPFPAVPHGSERLRISLTANHTPEELDHAVREFERAGRAAGVLTR